MYGELIHNKCERRPHFEFGEFALAWGDEGAQKGWCLYKLGCKGPETYGNCSTLGFGDAGENNWPVGCGHPCIGCSEKDVGFTKPIHQVATVINIVPPQQYPRIVEESGKGASFASAAALAALAGAAAGAAVMLTRNLGLSHQAEEAERAKSGSKAEEKSGV
jgi:hydrogenase small subunit